MLSRLSIVAAGAFLLFGAAHPVHAAVSLNGVSTNSITHNSITHNSITHNAVTPTAFLSSASAIGDLNGVFVQAVEPPPVRQ